MRAVEQTPIRSAAFLSVIGSTLFIMLGFGLIVPALPQFAKKLGVGDAGVGVILFGFALTRLIGDFFAGALIDRFGERAMVIAGAAIVGVSSLGAGASKTFAELAILRGLGGFGSAFFLGALTAYLVGTVAPEERGRAMSIFQASVGVGLLLGPLIGGLIISIASVNVPLYVYGAICLAFGPLALRAMRTRVPAGALADAPELPEEAAPAPVMPTWRRLRPLLDNSAYRAALGVSAVTFVIVSAPQTVLPRFWTDVLHHSKATSGIPFFVEALAAIAVIWHAGALSDKRGRKSALVPAMAVTTLAALALGFATNAVTLLSWMAILGLAGGYSRPGPTAMIADIATPEDRAAAVAGFRIAGDIGALIGPIIAGVMAQYVGYGSAWFAVAGCALLVFVMTVAADETAPALREPA